MSDRRSSWLSGYLSQEKQDSSIIRNQEAANRLSPAPPIVPPLPASPETVPVVWHPGHTILDLYEVTQELGKGGMGIVHKVHHKGWNTDLAVKSPLAEVFTRPGGLEDFERECETWANLGLHPNTVSCYYVRRLSGIPRVFAEYVAGGSLQEWIEDGRLYAGGPQESLKRIVDLAIQFAWGVQHAHEAGLIHQDIKPANVMMTPDGRPKVTDFGLAKARALAGEASGGAGMSILVNNGGLMTTEYCSPEQYEGKPLSRKTDVWSWGVSVLDMFVGGHSCKWGPVAGETLEGLLVKGVEKDAVPAMPAAMAAVLRQCFRQDPQERPADMLAVADALLRVYDLIIGEKYLRERPTTREMRADSLNNRAVSLLDLGKREEAEKIWEEVLQIEPQHLETTYNRGLTRWRAGRTTAEALLSDIRSSETLTNDIARTTVLKAQVMLECDDCESALQLIEALEDTTSRRKDVQVVLAEARRRLSNSRRSLLTFEGHTSSVNSVCLSADGRFALSGSDDHTLRLWEVATGRCLRTFEGHADRVNSVCLSADCQFALSGSHDDTLRLWEVATGRCLRTFEGLTSWVHTVSQNAVCLSADGRFALSGNNDNAFRLWEVATGRCLRTFEGHTGSVNSVCLSADGRFALSGSGWLSWRHDHNLRLWEVVTGRCLHTFEGHTKRADSVCLSADGRFALSGSRDDTLRLWEVETGRCLHTFEGHTGSVNSVCLSADGRFALSGSSDHTLRLWAVMGNADCLPASEELSRLITTDAAASATVKYQQDIVAGREALLHGDAVSALQAFMRAQRQPGFQRDYQILNEKARLNSLLRHSGLAGGWEVGTFEGHTDGVISVCLGADSRFALSGSADKTLRLWEVETGRCLRTFEGHTEVVRSVCLSTDGRFALSGATDKLLKLWDVATGRCLRTFEGHTDWVNTACLSADGRFALSGSADKTLRLWEVETGRCLRIFEGRINGINSVCLSGDNRFALSGTGLEPHCLWEVATGKCLRIFEEDTGGANVCLSADGRFALSGGDRITWQTPRLWDIETGRCLRTFEGHTDGVTAVCLSTDGRFALSGATDKLLKLWDVATGRCLRTFEGHTDWVNTACLSADGRWVVSGDRKGHLRRWYLDWELEENKPADWSEEARPYLHLFLSAHTPYSSQLPQHREPTDEEITRALTRRGKPIWSEEDFQGLLYSLGCAGFGWLRPEGVRRELEKMAAVLQGPPPLPELPPLPPLPGQ